MATVMGRCAFREALVRPGMLGRDFLSRASFEGAECGGKQGGVAIDHSLGWE